jgi:alpha 1,6-mannosyltransferase
MHNVDLGARYNVTWPSLRHVPNEGILFGHEGVPADVLVLSVTAFSPGVGNFGSGDVKSEAALVQHFFSGSWKHD